MTVINTNSASLITQAALAKNTRGLQATMEQLSTGKRINSAADDAAGLAIANNMTAQVTGLHQAIRNANDGIGMLQTAESAADTITSMLQRMRELSIQSMNGTYSSDNRTSMQLEYSQLYQEIQRVAATTQWNGFPILNGTTFPSGGVQFKVGAGTDSKEIITVTFGNLDPSGASGSHVISGGYSDLDGTSISSALNAQTAISGIDSAMGALNSFRSRLGASINRLQFTVDNLTNVSTHIAESRSRVEDVDYSEATSELARHQIIQQAATAMLAQANQMPQTVLKLLQG